MTNIMIIYFFSVVFISKVIYLKNASCVMILTNILVVNNVIMKA